MTFLVHQFDASPEITSVVGQVGQVTAHLVQQGGYAGPAPGRLEQPEEEWMGSREGFVPRLESAEAFVSNMRRMHEEGMVTNK